MKLKFASGKKYLKIGLLLLLIALLFVIPGKNVQAASAVAKVGSRKFTTLNKAFDAVGKKGTITLLKNVTLKKPIVLNKNKTITVNMKNHKITTKKSGQFNIYKGTVTFKNGTMQEKRRSSYGAYSILMIYKKGSVVLKNIKYTGHIDIGGYSYAKNNGSLKIDGGTYKPSSQKAFLINNFGKLVISKGSFQNVNNGNTYGIVNNHGKCTINGGTFTSNVDNTYVLIAGDLNGHRSSTTINGGTFQYSGTNMEYYPYGIVFQENTDAKITGGNILTSIHNQGAAVTMTGGTITGKAPAVYVDADYGGKTGSFTMSGGTVTGNVNTNYRCAMTGKNIKVSGGTIVGGGDVVSEYSISHHPVIETYAASTVSVTSGVKVVNRGSGVVVGLTTYTSK